MSIITRGNIVKPKLYLLNERFDNDTAAPITSPRQCMPGGGFLTIVDAESKQSITNGKLSISGGKASPAWGDPRVYSANSFSRIAGRVLYADLFFTSGLMSIGWQNTPANGLPSEYTYLSGGSFGTRTTLAAEATNPVVISTGTRYELACVLKSSGNVWLIRGGIYAQWTLAWVHNTSSGAVLYPSIANNTGVYTVDTFKVIDLGAPWTIDYGFATSRTLNPSTSATAQSTPNCLIDCTFTYNTTTEVAVHPRYVDSNNRWKVYASIVDGKVRLLEVNVGVSTERGISGAAVFVNGNTYRMVIIVDGNVYRVYIDDLLIFTYTDAGNFLTTNSNLTLGGVGTGMAELTSYPRYPAFTL